MGCGWQQKFWSISERGEIVADSIHNAAFLIDCGRNFFSFTRFGRNKLLSVILFLCSAFLLCFCGMARGRFLFKADDLQCVSTSLLLSDSSQAATHPTNHQLNHQDNGLNIQCEEKWFIIWASTHFNHESYSYFTTAVNSLNRIHTLRRWWWPLNDWLVERQSFLFLPQSGQRVKGQLKHRDVYFVIDCQIIMMMVKS